MDINTEDLLHSILENLDKLEYIKSDEIPNIDLYMDQLTTFMDSRLRNLARNPGEDKVMTKTMINNYAKNDLLPPSVKKKYCKEHVLLLLFIYYFKGILSINDIQNLLKPLTDQYFQNGGQFGLEEIYEEVFSMEAAEIQALKKDMEEKYVIASETFQQVEGEEREFLQRFAFICLLSYDVYMKKLIIEKTIDGFTEKLKKEKAGQEKGKGEKEKK